MNVPGFCPLNISSSRSIHAIDLENELGGTEATPAQITEFYRIWSTQAVGVRPGDRVIVSTSHRMARNAWFALPSSIQRVVRSGPSGADTALIEAIDIPHDSGRFARLVLGSGDGIFLNLALDAKRSGMVVQQVLGCGDSNRELTAACTSSTRIRVGVQSVRI